MEELDRLLGNLAIAQDTAQETYKELSALRRKYSEQEERVMELDQAVHAKFREIVAQRRENIPA